MTARRALKTTGTFRPLQELSSPTSQPVGLPGGARPGRQLHSYRVVVARPKNSTTCSGLLSIPAAMPMNAQAPETSQALMRLLLCSAREHHANSATNPAFTSDSDHPRATTSIKATESIALSETLGAYFYGGYRSDRIRGASTTSSSESGLPGMSRKRSAEIDSDTLNGIENVTGGSGDDRIGGNAAAKAEPPGAWAPTPWSSPGCAATTRLN